MFLTSGSDRMHCFWPFYFGKLYMYPKTFHFIDKKPYQRLYATCYIPLGLSKHSSKERIISVVLLSIPERAFSSGSVVKLVGLAVWWAKTALCIVGAHSHMYLSGTWSVAYITEELNFRIVLIFINLNLETDSHFNF